MKKNLFTLILFVLSSLFATAQDYLPFEQVRKYTKLQTANKYDSSLKYLTNRLGAEIHYLYPLYQAIGWEEKFKTSMGEKSFNASFSDMLSFAGDYHQAIAYQEKVKDEFFDELRSCVDKLELQVDDREWYLPKYRELLFLR